MKKLSLPRIVPPQNVYNYEVLVSLQNDEFKFE